jgi:hypothetical protein
VVICSEDNGQWSVSKVIEKAGLDLRDLKFVVFKNKIILSFFARREQDYVIQSLMVSSKDGTLWALVRDDQRGQVPALCKINAPYNAIESTRHLTIKIGGPMIKRFNGASVIIARCWSQDDTREQRYDTRADVFILEDFKEIRHIRSLPSGGDCSYASWADLGEGKALVSYYSSHEYKMDAPCREDNTDGKDLVSPEHSTAADIYLAEISYKI